jgi:peroxiredoxin (alkyl hydroperoxide reductase subunit C)
MSTLVQRPAPPFLASALMPDGTFDEEIALERFRGRYVALFFYPLDFTFVCPSEILAFDRRIEAFEERECQVLGCSVDSHYTHFAWRNTPPDSGGIGPVRFPLVSDLSKRIARDYGILADDSVALRATFLIDRGGVVRHQVVNDLGLGRDVDELLRVLDALRHVEVSGEVCPSGWKKGDPAMVPSRTGVASYLKSYRARL